MAAKQTHTQFVDRANTIHNNLYTYKNAQYINFNTKLNITCKIHGDFPQTPKSHIINKSGCPKCAGNARGTTESFIAKATKIHGNKYDYSLVAYRSNDTRIDIICPEHGIFEQTPRNHLVKKSGCPKCAGHLISTIEEFVERSQSIHDNLYDYHKVEYVNQHTKVTIICKIHGDFLQTPSAHIHSKNGCPKCNYSKGEQIIERFLISNNISFIAQYCPKNLTNASKRAHYRFDFFIPEHNILIEFDGVQHDKPIKQWNTNYTSFDKIQYRDNVKNEYARTHNIPLYRIKYKDINKLESILCDIFYPTADISSG